MCWNSTSSLTSFIFGYTICIFLFIRNKNYDRFYSIFMMYVLLVQLFEYLMWEDQKCKSINNISNQLLAPIILLQPIILSIVTLIFVKVNKNISNFLIISTIISFIIVIISYVLMQPWKDNYCSKPKDNECHSLQWDWMKKNNSKLNTLNTLNYFILCLIILIILFNTKNIYLIIFVIYLIITLLISIMIKPFNNSEYSHWCFFSVGLPFLKLFI